MFCTVKRTISLVSASVLFINLAFAVSLPSKENFKDGTYFNGNQNMIPKDSPTSENTKLVKFDNLKKGEPFKGVKTYKYNFDNGLFTVWKFEKGAFVPVHEHDSDQITHITKGKVKIVQGSDNKEFIFTRGDTFVLPAFVFHYLEALETSEMIGVNPATVEGKSETFKH